MAKLYAGASFRQYHCTMAESFLERTDITKVVEDAKIEGMKPLQFHYDFTNDNRTKEISLTTPISSIVIGAIGRSYPTNPDSDRWYRWRTQRTNDHEENCFYLMLGDVRWEAVWIPKKGAHNAAIGIYSHRGGNFPTSMVVGFSDTTLTVGIPSSFSFDGYFSSDIIIWFLV